MDAVADDASPFHLYGDAVIDGFGAALQQERPHDSVRPIAFISRATFDPQRYWTLLGLEAGCIVLAIKHLRRYLWGTKRRVPADLKALESIGKVLDCSGQV